MADDPLRRLAVARVGAVLDGRWRIDRLSEVDATSALYAGSGLDGANVVIHVLHGHLAEDAQARDRFLREPRISVDVGHAGLVATLAEGTCDGAPYFVTEALEGRTLRAAAELRGGRVGARELLTIADRALDILDALHDRDVVHGNVGPDALFITTAGRLKLILMGPARGRESSDLRGQAARSEGDATDVGDLACMSPERARGEWERVDERSDVFSLGAALFALFAGRTVHGELRRDRALLAASTARAPALASVAPDAPPELAALVDRALAFDPDARWPDAVLMGAHARAALQQLSREGAPPSLVELATRAVVIEDPETEVLTSPRAAPAALPFDTGATPVLPPTRAPRTRVDTGTLYGDRDLGPRLAESSRSLPFDAPPAEPARRSAPKLMPVEEFADLRAHLFEAGAARAAVLAARGLDEVTLRIEEHAQLEAIDAAIHDVGPAAARDLVRAIRAALARRRAT